MFKTDMKSSHAIGTALAVLSTAGAILHAYQNWETFWLPLLRKLSNNSTTKPPVKGFRPRTPMLLR